MSGNATPQETMTSEKTTGAAATAKPLSPTSSAPFNANPDALEVAPGFAREQLEGWIPALATEEEIRAALEKAFDYRGDITITRKDNSKIEGYLFDRRTGKTLADSVVRIYPKDSNEKVSVAYSDIAALAFTGRDTAQGKSFDAWVRKYWEKKAAGEKDIALTPEKLD